MTRGGSFWSAFVALANSAVFRFLSMLVFRYTAQRHEKNTRFQEGLARPLLVFGIDMQSGQVVDAGGHYDPGGPETEGGTVDHDYDCDNVSGSGWRGVRSKLFTNGVAGASCGG